MEVVISLHGNRMFNEPETAVGMLLCILFTFGYSKITNFSNRVYF